MKKENDDITHDITHGIIAYELKNSHMVILHFVGYWNKPTAEDFVLLGKELNTDPQFNLVGRIDRDVFLMEAENELVELFKKQL